MASDNFYTDNKDLQFIVEQVIDWPAILKVKDTVGAGDSFLAALLHGWLAAGLAPAENLKRAARVAEFVATCDGAMPSYRLDSRGYPVPA